MKVVDVNVLIYAIDPASPHNPTVSAYWNALLSGNEGVGLPWFVLIGFVRLTTNARVYDQPLSVTTALDLVDEWLSRDVVSIPTEKPTHARMLRNLLEPVGSGGNLTTDAHLAAIALTHDATLVSCDRDFLRFPGLRVENPSV